MRTLEGYEYVITCTTAGFFVNESKERNFFDPNESKVPAHSHSLVGLIYQISPKFRVALEDHMNNILRTESLLLWRPILKHESWLSPVDGH